MMPVQRPVLHSHCAGQDNFSITATLEVLVYLLSIFSSLPHYFQSKMSGELKKSFKILSCTVLSHLVDTTFKYKMCFITPPAVF